MRFKVGLDKNLDDLLASVNFDGYLYRRYMGSGLTRHLHSGASYPESIISIGWGEICRASKPGASGSEMLSCPINST